MRQTMVWLGALATALLLAFGAAPANASVDDFSYDSWDVHYELSLNDGGRADAQVTETLVAVFPDFDQNRGIVRGIPLRYEGAPAAPQDIEVTDGAGNSVPFSVEDDDLFRMILVGDNRYVHGTQKYVITYTIRDVIIQASETQVDEFYWDILPFERNQQIDKFTATVSLSAELSSQLTGSAACYFGYANSTDACEISDAEPGSSSIVTAPMEVRRGLGVTIAIAFSPGTAVQPPERSPSFALDVAPALLAGTGALIAGGGVLTIRQLRRKRRTYRGAIVAQYDVPPYLPPLIAGPLTGAPGSTVAAEFIHLAVSGALRIEEPQPEPGKQPARASRKFFRLLDPAQGQDPLDQMMLHELFPGLPPGEIFELPKQSTTFSTKMQRVATQGGTDAKVRGYFTRESSKLARILSLAALAILLVVGVLLAMGASRQPGPGLFISWVFIVITAIAAIIGLMPHKVYTPLGAETREYLEGVREFIRVVETDRFKMLQSYSGAERFEDGTVNVVHIYEKLLPYAMVFGLEKEWGRALQLQYEQQGVAYPIWYPAMFTHGSDLGRSFSSFTSSLSSDASYTSSSSGGSSGGGFSGGGGGGGFSGGR